MVREPTRVLHFVSGMNRGGVETFIMNVYRELDKEKVQFDFAVLAAEHCDYDSEIQDYGGRIFRFSSPRNLLKYYRELTDFFRTYSDYCIVHLHTESSLSIINSLFLAARGTRVRIAHSHSTQTNRVLLHKCLRPIFVRTCTHFLACSKDAGIWLFGRRLMEQAKVKVIRNAVDASAYAYDRNVSVEVKRELGITGRFVIGHVGRFSAVKNHEFLIDVFREVHRNDPKALLLLVGKGETEPVIREKVKKLGLTDDVLFLGLRSDVDMLMQAMDIFVLPSLYEGLPVTLIEAQAAGLPVIAASSITDESDITGLVAFVSLDESVERWALEILSRKLQGRRNRGLEIQQKGYDVRKVSQELQDFYISLIKTPERESI